MVCAPVRRDNPRALVRGLSYGRTNMLYLTCIMIFSVYLAHYGESRAKDWVSVDCGTNFRQFVCSIFILFTIDSFPATFLILLL